MELTDLIANIRLERDIDFDEVLIHRKGTRIVLRRGKEGWREETRYKI